jgi:glucose/arabinose dehydrogenase
MSKRRLPLVAAAAVLLPSYASAEFSTERVMTGLNQPIFVAAPPGDPRLFVVEREGTIRIWDGAQLLDPPFLDIETEVNAAGEGGLLGLAFAPDYATSRAFYVYYTADGESGSPLQSRISRFRAQAGNPNLAELNAGAPAEKVLLRLNQPDTNHKGGTVAFGNDGLLYMAFGDGGGQGDPQDRAQDGAQLFGKMIRIDVDFAAFDDDYTIPASNPFDGTGDDIRDEIWAIGFRNPFRFSFDSQTGDLYVGDVGGSAFEEIDVESASDAGGRNYGWDVKEAEECRDPSPGEPPCNDPGFTDPVHAYGRFGSSCNAVTGGVVYRGSVPELRGHYFFADSCTSDIWTLEWDGGGGIVGDVVNRTAALDPPQGQGTIDAIVAFGEDADGEVYIVDNGGEVFRIVPEPAHALLLLTGGGVLAFAQRRARHRSAT